jgi:vacuolar-type H+-ATPase subunit H
LEAKGEKLLQDLASHEQVLVGRVEEARQQASTIVEQAREEAEELLLKAREDGDAATKAQLEQTVVEANAIREDILNAAQSEVGRIEKQAKANVDEAIKVVLDQVLP